MASNNPKSVTSTISSPKDRLLRTRKKGIVVRVFLNINRVADNAISPVFRQMCFPGERQCRINFAVGTLLWRFSPLQIGHESARSEARPTTHNQKRLYDMKQMYLLLFSLVAIAAHAEPTLNSESRAVLDRDRELNALIIKRDADTAKQYYDTEFMLTTSSGKMKSKQDMLNDISMPGLTMEVNETTDVFIRVRKDTAVLTGILHQRGILNGKAFDVRLRVTDTWYLTQGKWVILAGHASKQ